MKDTQEILETPFLSKKPSSLRYFQEGPKPINLKDWVLTIDGLIEAPLNLDMDQIRSMNSTKQHRRSVCVCLWTIKRHWKGVLLKDILGLANIDTEDPSLYIRQVSNGTEKGTYDSTIHLRSAVERDAILAYEVDGKELPLENGFPLRLIDFGLYNYKCVKALRRLEITRENKLGYWEEFAGYDLDGTVMPKKYYAVDLQRKIWFGGRGEVKDGDF